MVNPAKPDFINALLPSALVWARGKRDGKPAPARSACRGYLPNLEVHHENA